MSRTLRTALAVIALALTAGCSDLGGTDGKDYVGGSGAVITVAPEDRGAPVEVSGETLDGEDLDLADLRGSVVVVNVWGAWCTECRVEQPLLTEFGDNLPEGVEMVGIDVRDPSRDTAQGFVRTFEVPYPSLYDPGSEQLLRFPEPVKPQTIPSTIVLDRQGRLAALIAGQVPSALTLSEVVDEVAAEDG